MGLPPPCPSATRKATEQPGSHKYACQVLCLFLIECPSVNESLLGLPPARPPRRKGEPTEKLAEHRQTLSGTRPCPESATSGHRAMWASRRHGPTAERERSEKAHGMRPLTLAKTQMTEPRPSHSDNVGGRCKHAEYCKNTSRRRAHNYDNTNHLEFSSAPQAYFNFKRRRHCGLTASRVCPPHNPTLPCGSLLTTPAFDQTTPLHEWQTRTRAPGNGSFRRPSANFMLGELRRHSGLQFRNETVQPADCAARRTGGPEGATGRGPVDLGCNARCA